MENNTNITNEQGKIVATKDKIFLGILILLSLIFITGTSFIVIMVGIATRGSVSLQATIIISSISIAFLLVHFILYRRMGGAKVRYVLFLTAAPLIFFTIINAAQAPSLSRSEKLEKQMKCQSVCRLETIRDVLKSEQYQVKSQITQSDLDLLLGSWHSQGPFNPFFIARLDQDYYLGSTPPPNGDMASAVKQEYSSYRRLVVKGDYLEITGYGKEYLFLTDKGPMYLMVSDPPYESVGYRLFLVR